MLVGKGVRKEVVVAVTSIAPMEQYVSETPKVVVKGTDLRLYCFFAG